MKITGMDRIMTGRVAGCRKARGRGAHPLPVSFAGVDVRSHLGRILDLMDEHDLWRDTMLLSALTTAFYSVSMAGGRKTSALLQRSCQ